MTTVYEENRDNGHHVTDEQVGKMDVWSTISLEEIYRLNTEEQLQVLRQKLEHFTSQTLPIQDLNIFLQTTIAEIRKQIGCDRALVYRFNSEESGVVVAESRNLDWTPAFGEELPAVTFGKYSRKEYTEIVAIDDITRAEITPYQSQLLEKFQVKASLSVPIIIEQRNWGLLVLHNCDRPWKWQEFEINFLYQITKEISYRFQGFEFQKQLQQQEQEQKTIAKVVDKIQRSLDIEKIFQTATQEVRQFLECDRVSLYRFHPDWSGEYVAESVGGGWVPLVGPNIKTVWEDTHLQETKGGRYRYHENFVINDIYKSGHSLCHIEMLEQFQVKAYMIVPVFAGEKLWGLLATYQNTGARNWQPSEVSWLAQIGMQLGMAISQTEYIQKVQQQSQQLAQIAEQEKALTKIVNRIRQSLDVESIFKNTTKEVRQVLECDRVSVYRFNPDWSGEYIAESVANGWTRLVGPDVKTVWEDTHLQATQGGRYAKGESFAIDDIYQSGHSQCHIDLLEQFEVKAYVIAPVFKGNQLWGLLAAYQNTGARHWQETEINLLAQIGVQLGVVVSEAEYVQQVQQQAHKLAQIAEQEKALTKIVNRIRQSLDVESIFKNTTKEVRQVLECDRVSVYRFNPDWSGEYIAESVANGWTRLVGPDVKTVWEDTHLQETQGGRYAKGESFAIDDIYQSGHSQCHIDLLEQFEVKAYVIAPVFKGNQLWGLLAAYQNTGARHWQETEINLLAQIGVQLGVVVSEAEYVQKVQQQAQKLASTAERQQNLISLTQKIGELLTDKITNTSSLDAVFQATVSEIRQMLQADRTVIYRFNPDWSGEFVAESVTTGWTPFREQVFNLSTLQANGDCNTIRNLTRANLVKDTYLQETQGGRYQQKTACIVDDIYQSKFPSCYMELLEQFQAKAYLTVPIFQGRKLWGLLASYQNSGSRHWEEFEVSIMQQIAILLGVAIQQVENFEQIQQRAERDRFLSNITDKIRQSSDLSTISTNASEELRSLIKADRVGVYRFNENWGGEMIAESVDGQWVKLVGSGIRTVIEDTHLKETQGGRYANRENLIVNDISKVNYSPCYQEILAGFQAKAYAIVPVFCGQKLWGLLAAYQNSSTRQWETADIEWMEFIGEQLGIAVQQPEYLYQLQQKSAQIAKAAELDRAADKVIDKIRKSEKIDRIFNASTKELQLLLNVDRVALYRFNPDWSGEFVAESVATGWLPLVDDNGGLVIEDTYLQDTQGGRYRFRETYTVNDIYNAGHNQCHIEVLERLQARAYVIVPVIAGDKLWGLFAAYQNSGTREWMESEVSVLARIGDQLGVAIKQTEYLQTLQTQSQELAVAAARDKAAKEELQRGAMMLLKAVRPALDGDLTVRAPITEDELGTIADSYNNTIQALRQIVVQVQGTAQKVGQSSQDSNKVLSGLQNLSQKQSQEINQALTELQQMLDSTKVVAANADLVKVAVQEANQTVESGDAAMNMTVEAIQGIRETVSQTSKKIKRLGESSQKISKVVNLISSFATQTNVLALNAAIEATRAGEYGKGFAVVADEVRSLSRQSSTATTEIEKLVQEIQMETGEVAAAMETGIQQVVEGTNLVNETRQNLNAIVSATAKISELLLRITNATQAQMAYSETVTSSMKDVAEISQNTVSGTQEMAAVFQQLSMTAQELLTTVSKFKVN